jgi:hypothetical protein
MHECPAGKAVVAIFAAVLLCPVLCDAILGVGIFLRIDFFVMRPEEKQLFLREE